MIASASCRPLGYSAKEEEESNADDLWEFDMEIATGQLVTFKIGLYIQQTDRLTLDAYHNTKSQIDKSHQMLQSKSKHYYLPSVVIYNQLGV